MALRKNYGDRPYAPSHAQEPLHLPSFEDFYEGSLTVIQGTVWGAIITAAIFGGGTLDQVEITWENR